MTRYAAGIRTLAAGTATFGGTSPAYCGLFSGGRRCFLVGLEVFNTTTTAAAIALVTGTTRGTPTNTQGGWPYDYVGPTSLATLDSAWSSNPNISGQQAIVKRGMVPAAIGNGFIWTFVDSPIAFNAPGTIGLFLVNPVGTGQILDVNMIWEE